MAIPAVLEQFQVQPALAFRAAKIDPELLRHAENRIPLKQVGRLLEICARLTSCEHFGLLVGMRFKLSDLGALGYLMRNSATVGEALSNLCQHLHVHDRAAAAVVLAQSPEEVLLGYSIFHNSTRGIAQIYDTAIAIAYRILRELCGPSWKLQHVQFSHRRPKDTAPYKRVFENEVLFEEDMSGVVFFKKDLQQPITGANRPLYDILAGALQEAEKSAPETFREKVETALHQAVLGGTYSSSAVARTLGVHQRTLRRRLADEGVTFRELLCEARCEIAQQLLESSDLPVAGIAQILHYDDPTAFTRAFRKFAGVSPSQWREESAQSQSNE